MKSFPRETLLYLFALSLALVVRLVGLGESPLTDLEARWALQALGVAQGTHPVLGSQSAYVLLTSVLFFIYGGGTNFLARLIPALTGTALVGVPYLFRERLKPRPSLILAFFLALDPGLVALSRQAGSVIMAVTFALLAWGLWEKRSFRTSGVSAGLALLSGAPLWEGLLGLGLAWTIYQGLARGSKTESGSSPARNEWLPALWYGLGTLVVGGTLFFLSPNGLSAWALALTDYIRGWGHPSDVSAGWMSLSLIAYSPLAVLLGLIAAVRGWVFGGRRVMKLSLWALVALVLALVYPAHQISDLVWALIPLWALAALELVRHLQVFPEERGEVLGVTGLSVLILIFVWLDYLALLQTAAPSQQATLRAWLLFGSLFLLVVSILLVAVGWSIRSARLGALWSLVIVFGVYSFSAMIGAAGLRSDPVQEMWSPGGSVPQAGLLLTTVDQVSDWSRDNVDAQAVTIVGIDSPALEWLLRGHELSMVDTLDAAASPPIVVTTDQTNPVLAAGYRGQSFIWRQAPLWNNAGLPDWMRWLAFHQMPESTETIIVWVRSDLFLDSTGTNP